MLGGANRPFSQPRYTGRSFLPEARDQCAIDAAVFPTDGLTLPPLRAGRTRHPWRSHDHTFLTLDRVSYQLADGPLFSDLSFSFDPVATGLVGANGTGKSVLARLLAGRVRPENGQVRSSGSVFLLPTPGYPRRHGR